MNMTDFDRACELLPDGVTWGEAITPSIVKHIAEASQAQQPTSEQVEQAVSLLKSLRGLCDVEDYPTIDGIISTLAAQAQQEIEIDMLTGDVTWKFNEAQTQEPLEIQALTTICKLLDGSQPKDPLGALFVAQSALRQSQAQQESQWISVEERLPEKFVDVLVHPRPTDYICEAAWLGDAWYWSDYELNFGVITNKCVVTHWMPLPPAPEGGE